MTKTCSKCQAPFETEDQAKMMCPACEAMEKPAVGTTTPAPEAPAVETPKAEGGETPAGGSTPQA